MKLSDKHPLIKRLFTSFILLSTLAMSPMAFSEDFYEFRIASAMLNLDISEKRGPRFSDDFSNVGFGLAAYRQAGRRNYFGVVIEHFEAFGRDELPGSGTISGIRPVNFLYRHSPHIAMEYFLGAAQFQWEKKARGYYLGAILRYRFENMPLALSLDYRFYQDLAYDSALGDVIVQGNSLGLNLTYRFGKIGRQ